MVQLQLQKLQQLLRPGLHMGQPLNLNLSLRKPDSPSLPLTLQVSSSLPSLSGYN